MSFINFIIIFPNTRKGGKMYGLKLAHGIVNASTKDSRGSNDHDTKLGI
jgi:hypothetical protein